MKYLAGKVSHLLIAGILVMTGCGGGNGDPGAVGTTGEEGDSGVPGSNGANGDAGLPGTNGTNGANGSNGANGDAGVDSAQLNLNIINSITNTGISGATVALTPAVSAALTADNTGKISATLPNGDYALSISATGYSTVTQNIGVSPSTSPLIVKLVPTANVYVSAGTDKTGQAPGATVSLTGTATSLDGTTVVSTYSWTQTGGPTATLTGNTSPNPSVKLPPSSTYKDALIKSLAAPPITAASLDVTAPSSFPVRLDVLGINPHSIEDASTVVLTLTVTTSSGIYTSTVNVTADLPFQVTTGLRNVSVGIPQVLQAAALPTGASAPAAWNWTVNTAGAPGSAASITDPTSQYPIFTPDVIGTYVFAEGSTGGSITLYAGDWGGAIGGVSTTDGLPLISNNCAICHNNTIAPNKWPDWRMTGHAKAFSNNIDDPATNWTVTACASCHTVGYNTLASAANGGFDDVMTDAQWTQPPGAPNDYANMFKSSNTNVVKLASLANVQCDSCHGPTNSPGHPPNAGTGVTPDPDSRVSIKSEVCGSCHGAPPSYGRYQQWKESLHANYNGASRGVAAIANDNATTGDNRASSCARCHTGQGFLAWVDQSAANDGTTGNMNMVLQGAANNGNNGNATGAELRALGLTAAEVHPQTCATCHDPHATGNTSLIPNNATVRVSGDIGMTAGGFAAIGLGRGAVCVACHNSRNGKHDDTVQATDPVAPVAFGTPHDGPMSDVLLGVNAYFVTPGQRGGHSYIADTCATCHMELTPPPADLSFQGTGTNHTFKADLTICSNCHGAFDGGSLQSTTTASLASLAKSIANAAMTKLNNGTTGIVLWVRGQDPATNYFTSSASGTSNVTFDTSTNPITTASLVNASTFQITLQTAVATPTWFNGTTAATGPATIKTFNVSVSALKVDNAGAAGNLAFFPGSPTGAAGSTASGTPGTLFKALWNFGLLTNDQSLGVHNPAFYRAVIAATTTAMQNGAN
jgi:hypothetical protein